MKPTLPSLVFNPDDPFPLAAAGGSFAHAEAQAHAARVDAWLGIEAARTEAEIARATTTSARDVQAWAGLPVQSLLTPYTELREVLARLAPRDGDTVVDLGAAYGRMGFVLHRHHPGARFLGYELVKARVDEGARALRRFGCANAELLAIDLSAPDFSPASAAFYFLYDFGTRAAIEKTLGDLQTIARERPIVVVGRGRASRDAIERRHPWLSQVVQPEHRPNYSIYRSTAVSSAD